MELIELMERLPAGTRIQPSAAKLLSDRAEEFDDERAAALARFIEPGVAGDTPVVTWMDVMYVIANTPIGGG